MNKQFSNQEILKLSTEFPVNLSTLLYAERAQNCRKIDMKFSKLFW